MTGRAEQIQARLDAIVDLAQWYAVDEASEALEYSGVDARSLESDAELISNAPADLAWLLAERVKLQAAIEGAYPLIRDMTDPEECSFDHHGGCQAHGYLSLQSGEKCPHAEAKEWLAARADDQEGKR